MAVRGLLLRLEVPLFHVSRARERCVRLGRMLGATAGARDLSLAVSLEREGAGDADRATVVVSSCLVNRKLSVRRSWKPWRGGSRGLRIFAGLGGVAPIVISMPALSPTMEHGTIVKWIAQEGETVMAGDTLCEIETDKAVMSLDSNYDAILAKILVSEGVKDVKLGTVIALMVEEGEDPSQVDIPPDAHPPSATGEGREEGVDEKGGGADEIGGRSSLEEEVIAAKTSTLPLSPAVRYVVDTNDLDPSVVPATGPKGRLLKGDLLKYLDDLKAGRVSDKPTEPVRSTVKPSPRVQAAKPMSDDRPYTDIAVDEERRVLAQRAVQSKVNIPHSYATIQCSLDQILQVQDQLRDQEGLMPSVNDILIKVAAVTTERLPACNAVWSESGVQLLPSINIAVSIATEQGVTTPVIKDANRSSVHDIANLLKGYCDEHAGRLHRFDTPSHISLAISILDVGDVKEFWPILDPQHTSTLAIGSLEMRPDQRGQPSPSVTVSLSCDSRVVDYELACRWLELFRRIVESPSSGGLL